MASKSTFQTIGNLPALFMVGYLILIARSYIELTIFSTYMPESIDRILLATGSIALMGYIFSSNKAFGKAFPVALLALMLTAISYVNSGATAPFVASLIVIAAAPVENKTACVKSWAVFTAFMTVLLISLFICVACFAPELVEDISRSDGRPGRERLSFLFIHPNTAGAVLMMLSMCFLYCRRDKLQISSILASEAIALFILITTQSRTSFAIAAVVPLMLFAQKKWGVFSNRRAGAAAVALAIAFALITFYLSGPGFSPSRASLFTGRVALWNSCYFNQGITVFGQQFEQVQTLTGIFATLDSFYATCLYVYGLSFLAIFVGLLILRFKRWQYSYAWDTPIMLGLLVFGFTEVHILNPAISFPLLLLGDALLKWSDSNKPYGIFVLGAKRKHAIDKRRPWLNRAS